MAFQIDPGLITQASGAGNMPTPFEQYKSLSDMQNFVEAQKMRQQMGPEFDPQATLSYLAKTDPAAALKADSQSRVASAQEAKYGTAAALDTEKARVEQLKQTASQIDTISKVASGISDQASYESGLSYLRSQGIDVTDMPATYDPALVKSKADMALSAKDKLNAQIKQYQADTQASYYEGQLLLGNRRIDADMAMRQKQMDLTADTSAAKLNETERHNMAMEQRSSPAAAKSNNRVIERNGQIYLVNPETGVVSEGKTADGKEYRTPEQRALVQRSKQMLTTMQEAKAILKAGNATSGGLQNTLAGVARSVNITTDGMKDAAKLKNLAGWLTMNTPVWRGRSQIKTQLCTVKWPVCWVTRPVRWKSARRRSVRWLV